MKPFYVYLLRCSDGSYYCGQTDHLESRLQQHDAGDIGYTSTRKPVELLWQGEFETREGAIAFEQQIKGWSRVKKEALIAGDWKSIQKHAWGTRHPLPSHLADSPSIPQPEQLSGSKEIHSSVRPEVSKGLDVEDMAGVSLNKASIPQPEQLSSPGEIRLPARPEVSEDLAFEDADGTGLDQASIPQPEQLSGSKEIHLPVRPEVSKGLAVEDASGVSINRASIPQGEQGRALAEAGLVNRILHGDAVAQRRGIAKAITLLESTRADHREQADELLTALLPSTGKSFRLGISGVPGVGKSTFIEVLGLYLIKRGHRVAALTIDPSSTVSGGSILGDKTRMEMLSVHERAYIRPSPSSGTLGGVAEKTREAMLVCEAAGYDVVIVETVGVGQSETAVSNMTDMFVLMQLPNAGDDLQAIKKGVMELADLVIINKADIDADAAMRAQAQITSAMRLFGLVNNAMGSAQAAAFDSFWHPQVIQLSALHNKGVDAFWVAVTEFKTLQTANGRLAERRKNQSLSWMWERIDAGLKQAFRHDRAVGAMLPELLAQVANGQMPASTAARNLLAAQSGRAAEASK